MPLAREIAPHPAIGTAPSVKATVPVAAGGVTVALMVTAVPTGAVLRERETDVVVATGGGMVVTVTVVAEARWPLSPL